MLTTDQLKRIDKHLRSENWLLNNDLIAELTDHYIDAIADRLAQHIPFETAIYDVHRSFGGRRGLLRMEENFQKTQAKTNARVYRNAFMQAFRWPGLGYTVSVWLGVYQLLINLPVTQLIAFFNSGDTLAWVGLLSVCVGLYGSAYVALYRHIRAGAFSFSNWSSPVYAMAQSTIFVVYLVAFLPFQRLIATYPALGAAFITLVAVHEWAGFQLIAFVYRKRVA